MAEQVRLELVVVDKTGAALGKAKGNVEGLNKSLGRTRGLAKLAAGALIAIGTAGVVRGLVNTIRTFEDLRATLVTVEGSVQAAGKSFNLIKEFTAGTTFQLDEVTNAFITFRNAGLVPTEQFMLNIGNIAAGMGRRLDDVAKAVFNATTGEFEMLKQLGIKVKTESDKLKVIFRGTTTEIRNNGIDIVNLVEEIGAKEFKGGIERSAKTLSGAFSNLQDAVAIAADEVGEGGLTAALSEVTREITKTTLGTANLANQIGSALGNAILFVKDNFTLLKNAIKVLALGLFVKQVYALRIALLGTGTVLKGLTAAVAASRVVFMKHPLFFLATVAVGGIILFKDQLQKLGEKFGFLTPKVEESAKATEDFMHEMSEVPTVSAEASMAQKILEQQQEAVASATKKVTDKLHNSIRALEANAIANLEDAEIYKLKHGVLKDMTAEQEKEIRQLIRKEQELKKVAAAEKALPSIMKKVGGDVFESPEVVAMQKEVAHLEILRNKKKISEQQYQTSITKIREDAARAEANRRDREQSDVIDLIKQGKAKEIDIEVAFGKDKKGLNTALGKELLGELAQINEKAFKIAKAVAISETIISTAKGVMFALGRGAFLQAALIAATGAVQIAKIKSTSYTGPREKGGPVAGGQPYLVGETGPEMFVPNAGGQIVPNGAMGKQVTVNFNIETVDATGFDELLLERRSTIVGVINEAMNRQGREGITA